MTDLKQLAEQIVDAIKEGIEQVPMSERLWRAKEIAVYMRRTERQVAERTVYLPGFPKPIRIPTGNGSKGHPLWKAREIVEWVEKHQERRAA